MATTDIHAITQTVGKSISYAMSDKVESSLKDDIADSINYAMNDKTGEVTYTTISTVMNCCSQTNPSDDFQEHIKKYGQKELLYGNAKTKDGKPILAWHLVQSFEGHEVDPITANEIGVKLAEELFGNFPVVVSTHTNTDNIHNHFVICAWDLDGKKYNYDHAAYDKIRECSDRLCDEYGLSVLEHTKERKLVRWTDEEGNVRYYEPTDRKNDLIKKREVGEISTDDVNSYRNTIPYEVAEGKKQTNAEIVKQAIDSALPYATSYEHLLTTMREMGFKVKDKKKNGDWLAHITFTPPTADKGVRDYKIGDGNYYTRENLTAVIEEQNKERNRNEVMQTKLQIPHYEEYVYGEIDVQKINEDYRADIAADGGAKIVQRGDAEKAIIRDVKKSDIELYGLYDTTTIRKLVEEQKEAKKHKIPPKKREEILVRQIQDSFENLRFIERKQLYSYAQINEIVKGLWTQYNSCLSKISEAEDMVDKLESVTKAPIILKEIKSRMEQGKNDPEYMIEKYPQDVKLMKSCINAMKKHDVNDKASMESLKTDIQKYREKISKLKTTLTVFSNELTAYNRCVETLARIDRDSGRNNTIILMEYEKITKSGQEKANETNEKRKQKGYER